ncbi:Slp family lipoprotein [Alteromonas lipotrueiana]|uniref:Slp family lipoprotein n=1 Tax=Alteromonas lipotrueiana TaxID=2803815 RepID=UPI001C462F95|nr:Slp family lipoprotein [Alteromonas lipotrueiana]
MSFRLMLISTLLFVSGCTMVPDNLAVPDGTALVTYQGAVTGGPQVTGRTARWGGVIAGVENKPEKTFIEIVHFPLNSYGRPNTSEETIGRFKVKIDGFVDPIVFEEGRSVTFLGSVDKPITGMVGEQPYTFPAVKARDYHLWRETSTYDVSTLYFNYNTGWYSPFYYRHSLWGPQFGFGTSRIRVIESRGFQPKLKQSNSVQKNRLKRPEARSEPVTGGIKPEIE